MPAEAADVYNDIVKRDVTDAEALKGAKDATARASMKKQKWEQADGMRDVMKDEEGRQELEAASRTGMTRDQLEAKRDRLIEKYNEDANDLATVKELAGVFEELEDWPNAATFFDWAHQLSTGDVALRNKASVMNERAAEFEIRRLHDAVKENPDDEALRRDYEEKKSARLAEQLEVAKKRVDQNPTDPQLRFEYGQALYHSGEFGEAIPQLQQATRNPHIRTRVLLLLGRTFRAKNMFDLSIKQLADALADLHAMDNTKKEVLYEKGLIHDEMGDKDAALECFKQIYEVDYGYRDVAKRVEDSYGG
jgi:tetratricopeptide (TPR) repeat protein